APQGRRAGGGRLPRLGTCQSVTRRRGIARVELPTAPRRPIFLSEDRASHKRRPRMDIQALGYVGIRAKSLEDWTSFGTRFLGMQPVERNNKTLTLRMDDRKQRVVVNEDGGEGVAFFGWEVSDASTLDGMAARLERARIQVSRGARALADERRVKDLIVL